MSDKLISQIDPRATCLLAPGVLLDANRALWLVPERVLAVADLHLGYAWTHRHAGNLLPLSAAADSVARLVELVERYQPRELVLLGDVVHRALPLAALRDELRALFTQLRDRVVLRLLSGNHDRRLGQLLRDCGLDPQLLPELRVGPHLLLHGDAPNESNATKQIRQARTRGGFVIIGHEHPAISLSDGVATRAKVPCFLASANLLVLPAFSTWAAGTVLRTHDFLSAFTRESKPDRAFAIVARKLLPMPLAL